MFDKESLVQSMIISGCFCIIQMIVLIVLGVLLASNIHYHELLGMSIRDAGNGLIFTGILYFFAAILGLATARTKNKCLLLVQVILLGLIYFFQTVMSAIALVGSRAPSLALNYEFQIICLTVGKYEALSDSDKQLCQRFFHSDEFAGVMLVWQNYYNKSAVGSKEASSYRAMVLNIQQSNFCCGYGLPRNCVIITDSFPSSRPKPTVLNWSKQRQNCSKSSGMYLPTTECQGACSFALPSGSCGKNLVNSASRGCAAFVSKQLSSQVQAISATALVLALFPIIFIVGSVCLCMKRRDQDVRPHIEFASKVRIHAEI
ncbi:putative tetraspanin/Peripherin [Plasmopara halstedii]